MVRWLVIRENGAGQSDPSVGFKGNGPRGCHLNFFFVVEIHYHLDNYQLSSKHPS